MRCQAVFHYSSCVASDKSQQAVCSRVAQMLRQAREKRGLSMNQVAERSGLSQQMISYVERGMRNPTLETVLRIAAALDIDFPDLMRQAIKTTSK